MSVEQLEKKIKKASDAYYNGEQIMEDEEFDTLVEKLRYLDPKNSILKEIGAPIRKDVVKVKLPYHMGSLDKIKPGTRDFDLWFERHLGPYFVTQKLDGISGLLEYKDSKIKIYTRGDGKYGQDISFLKDYLRLPNIKKDISIRGEFIMKKQTYEKKYSSTFPKARSVVSGVINSKKPSIEILKDIDFVSYELVYPGGFKWSKQFEVLEKMKFLVPDYFSRKVLDVFELEKQLSYMKKTSRYEIDGLVVSEDKNFERKKSGNPEYSVAFKVNSEGVNTVVQEVIWNPSKYGVLVPKIRIDPVIIDGDTVTYASVFNAKYVLENEIGKGTKIKIVKSGDVIPYISKIVKSTGADFPDYVYHWNETSVDIILDSREGNKEVDTKRLLNFFTTLKIENVSIGVVTKLFEAGFDSPEKVFHMTIDNFMSLPSVKEKSAHKLFNSIHQVLDNPIPLERVMASSLVFGNGFGEKKLAIITKEYPDILEKKLNISDITKLEGFSEKTASVFIQNLPGFFKFLKKNSYFEFEEKKENDTGILKKEIFVFSGFRDKELEKLILSKGGEIGNSVTSKTTFLIVKDDKETSKTKKAKELNVKIVLLEKFKI